MPQLALPPTVLSSTVLFASRLRHKRKTVQVTRLEVWGNARYRFEYTYCRNPLIGRAIPASRRWYASRDRGRERGVA